MKTTALLTLLLLAGCSDYDLSGNGDAGPALEDGTGEGGDGSASDEGGEEVDTGGPGSPDPGEEDGQAQTGEDDARATLEGGSDDPSGGGGDDDPSGAGGDSDGPSASTGSPEGGDDGGWDDEGDDGPSASTGVPEGGGDTPSGEDTECYRAATITGYLDSYQTADDGRVLYCHQGHFVDSDIDSCSAHMDHSTDYFPTSLCDT